MSNQRQRGWKSESESPSPHRKYVTRYEDSVENCDEISEDASEGSSDESIPFYGNRAKEPVFPSPKVVTGTSQKVYQYERQPHRQPITQLLPKKKVSPRSQFIAKFSQHKIVAAVAVLVGIFFAIVYWEKVEGKRHSDYNLKDLLLEIKKTFPNQKNTLWEKTYSAVNTPLNATPTHPAVLLLLYSDSCTTSNCLVSKIAEKSSLYLQPATQSPIILDASDSEFKSNILENNDTFIPDYKNKVQDQVTMVVKNLQSLPSIIAEKLHFFCDEYEPLVPKALFIFTMKVSNSNMKPTSAAEEEFKKLWGKVIDKDALDPLITRLTSEVEFVYPESSVPC